MCKRAAEYGLSASDALHLQPERPPVEPDVSTEDVAPPTLLF